MIHWPDIDTAIFDMDGTLLDLHFDNYFWEQLLPATWGAKLGIPAEEAWRRLRADYQQMQGQLQWYCIDYWSDKLQIDIQQLKEQTRGKIAVRDDVPDFLEHLRMQDKTLLLVTNAHPGSLNLKLEHTGIGNHFAATISSHQLGLAKENSGFWRQLQQLRHYDPARTVLFDDNLNVLRQARTEGIRHLFAIEQPDSQRPPLNPAEFPAVRRFRDLMP